MRVKFGEYGDERNRNMLVDMMQCGAVVYCERSCQKIHR